MKYPRLVRQAKTDIRVTITSEEMSEVGEREIILDADLKCNYQDKAYTKVTTDKQVITLTGKAYFDGDIAPSIPVITGGRIIVFGATREIYRGTKARNPDGTENYTLLEIK